MSHDIKNGLDAGFFRYLTKPIVVDDGWRWVVQGVTSLEELARVTRE
ncbi:MAG: hypothetical protein AAB294_04840 [Pseudomonadota bacterium]